MLRPVKIEAIVEASKKRVLLKVQSSSDADFFTFIEPRTERVRRGEECRSALQVSYASRKNLKTFGSSCPGTRPQLVPSLQAPLVPRCNRGATLNAGREFHLSSHRSSRRFFGTLHAYCIRNAVYAMLQLLS